MPVDTRMLLQMLPQIISLISEASKLIPSAGAVPRYLDILAVLVGQGTKAYDELVALKGLVKLMVQEKREPTDDEWTSWQVRSDIAHDAIQNYDIEGEQVPLLANEVEKPTK